MTKPDFYHMHAAHKVPLPEGWEIYRWEVVNHDTPARGLKVTGCVPSCTYKRGPRKGHPNFGKPVPGTTFEVQFTSAEHDQFLLQWEVETGRCSQCGGSGEEWSGWSVSDGTQYRPCRRCSATGKSPEEAA